MSEARFDDPGMELDLAAAEVRADSEDLDVLLAALAARLEDALPRAVSVRRRKVGGFRSKHTEVVAITLDIGDERLELRRTPTGFDCTRHEVVRGITLRRERRTLGEWIDDVVAAAGRNAQLSERARASIEAIVR